MRTSTEQDGLTLSSDRAGLDRIMRTARGTDGKVDRKTAAAIRRQRRAINRRKGR